MSTNAHELGCFWVVRVLCFGLDRNGRYWGRTLQDTLLPLLDRVPVRFHVSAGRLRHPRPLDGVRSEPAVGEVVHVWADTGKIMSVFHLHHEDDRAAAVRRGLIAMEHDRVLTQIGVSVFIPEARLRRSFNTCGGPIEYVTAIKEIEALDLVSTPAADGCVLGSTTFTLTPGGELCLT